MEHQGISMHGFARFTKGLHPVLLDEIGWIAGPCGLGFFLLSPV